MSLLDDELRFVIDGGASPSGDASSNKFREELSHYTGGFLKAVPLLTSVVSSRAKVVCYLASAVLNGLDQVKRGDDLSTQLEDFSLGAAKGVALKGSFEFLGGLNYSKVNALSEYGLAPSFLSGKPLELAAKATGFGVTSRSVDTLLSRESYRDEKGDFHVGTGLANTFSTAFSPINLATDLTVFSGSALGLKVLNTAFAGALERSHFVQNVATGFSFGYLSGAIGELQNQRQNSRYDISEIAWKGLLEGAVNGLAAAPGGIHLQRMATRTGSSKNESTASPADMFRTAETKAPASVVPDFAETQAPASVVADSAKSQTLASGVAEFAKEQPGTAKPVDDRAMEPAHSQPNDHALSTIGAVNPLGLQALEQVGENRRSEEGALFGAKKYQASDGMSFWQLADGRIFDEQKSSIWVPFGSKESMGEIASRNEGSLRIWNFDERYSRYHDFEGNQQHDIFKFPFLDSKASEHLKPEVVDKLTMSFPQFEEDWQAGLRVLATPDGTPYESTTLQMDSRSIEGLQEQELRRSEGFTATEIPARRYKIMSLEQVNELDDTKRLLKDGKLSEDDYRKAYNSIYEKAQTITVPESFGVKLDSLRELRRTAALSPRLLPELTEAINEARRNLYTSSFRNTMLPEHLGQYFDRLPDRTSIPNTILLEEPSYVYDTKSGLADANRYSNVVRFFDANNDVTAELSIVNTHEWSHTVHPGGSIGRALEMIIDAKGKGDYVGRPYGRTNVAENWAVNTGEMFLDPNPDHFLSLANSAPLKTVLIADRLSQVLKNAPPNENPQGRQELLQRLEYVEKNVLPAARAELIELSQDNPRILETLSYGKEQHAFIAKLIDLNELKQNGFDQFAGQIARIEQLSPLSDFLRTPNGFNLREIFKKTISAEETRAYATYPEHEAFRSWALTAAEKLMDPDSDYFQSLAKSSPLSSVILLDIIGQRTKNDSVEDSVRLAALQERSRFAEENLIPAARAELDGLFEDLFDKELRVQSLFGARGDRRGLIHSLLDAEASKNSGYSFLARDILKFELLFQLWGSEFWDHTSDFGFSICPSKMLEPVAAKIDADPSSDLAQAIVNLAKNDLENSSQHEPLSYETGRILVNLTSVQILTEKYPQYRDALLESSIEKFLSNEAKSISSGLDRITESGEIPALKFLSFLESHTNAALANLVRSIVPVEKLKQIQQQGDNRSASYYAGRVLSWLYPEAN